MISKYLEMWLLDDKDGPKKKKKLLKFVLYKNSQMNLNHKRHPLVDKELDQKRHN